MSGSFDKRFLEEEVQVVMIHEVQRQAFIDWLAEMRLEVFPIPHEGDDGELTIAKPKDDLMTYGIAPNDELWKEATGREKDG